MRWPDSVSVSQTSSSKDPRAASSICFSTSSAFPSTRQQVPLTRTISVLVVKPGMLYAEATGGGRNGLLVRRADRHRAVHEHRPPGRSSTSQAGTLVAAIGMRWSDRPPAHQERGLHDPG